MEALCQECACLDLTDRYNATAPPGSRAVRTPFIVLFDGSAGSSWFAESLDRHPKVFIAGYEPLEWVKRPERYTGWTDTLSEVVSIDWSGFFLPPQCLPYWSRLVAVTASPVAAIALLLLAGVGLRLQQWQSAPSPRPRPCAEATLGLLDLTPASLFLVFCFVPSVSAFIFRAWSCQAPNIACRWLSPPLPRVCSRR